MEASLIIALALSPFISGLLAIVKHTELITPKWLPVVGVVLGAVFGGIYAIGFNYPIPEYILGGFIGGMASGGFYNIIKIGGKA